MSCIHVRDLTNGAAMAFATDLNGFTRAEDYYMEIKREGHQAERRVLAASRAEVNQAIYARQLREMNDDKSGYVPETKQSEATGPRRQKERYRRPNFR